MPHKTNQKGFAALEAVLIVIIVALIAGVGYYVWHANRNAKATLDAASKSAQNSPSKTTSKAASRASQNVQKGIITGDLGYPAGSLPDQTVCAVPVAGGTPQCFDKPLAGGSDTLAYKIEVPVGDYYIYAHLDNDLPNATASSAKASYKAYYDQYVVCGEAASCPSNGHTQYVKVTVSANQTVTGVNPTDWYND